MIQRGVTTRTAAGPDQARLSLALWLRQGRAQRGMSVDDVAKVTKIQPRTIESLEAGRFDRLPADVFARGFVRSIARCVGLDADEALARFVAAQGAAGIVATPAPVMMVTPVVARALVETMSELAPMTAGGAPERVVTAEGSASIAAAIAVVESEPEPEPEIIVVVEEEVSAAVEAPKKKRTRKARGTDAPPAVATRTRRKKQTTGPTETVQAVDAAKPVRRRKKQTAAAETGTGAVTVAVAESVAETVTETVTEAATEAATAMVTVTVIDAESAASDLWAPRDYEPEPQPEPVVTATWSPRMPAATPSVPWRRAFATSTAPATVAPVLTIDDSDPESAEREREERTASRSLRSFLPPILLDRDGDHARQGGLTLAVIILLIAATLTLSYLMRRPSSSGDGFTQREVPASTIA